MNKITEFRKAHPYKPQEATFKKQLLGLAFKALNGYEAKTPRCGNCKHHTTAKVILRNSLPEIVVPPLCNLGQFVETGYGLCNEWESRKGERLDKHD